MKTNTEFDYIIVGAGSAGCVLANKLGADKTNSILIVEAGPMDHDLMIHIPAGVYSAWRNPKFNWSYETEPESILHNRQVEIRVARVVGGSSSINSMVYMRGHPMDYDGWADEFGLTDWRYSNCLPYFKSGESSDRGGDDWRGDSGLLGVTKGSYENPLYDAFIRSGEQAGQGYSEDLNGFNPEGVARLDATRKHGRRCSAAVAYLRPALKRGNVTLLTNTLVERVVMEGNRATGIELSRKGDRQVAAAAREVILSGGAINSPQLLMLSGIGPADHLRAVGVEPVVPLSGVGKNLQDHAAVITQFACKKSFPIHKVASPVRKAAAGLEWVFTRKGIAASNIWEAGGVIRGNDQEPRPNLQYHFGPVGFDYIDNRISLSQSFAIHIDVSRPQSVGAVTLKSNNAMQKPALTFNFFSVERDLDQMVEGIHKVRQLVSQAAFSRFAGEEQLPGPGIKTDEEIRQWIRQNSETDYHPCGTCRMGNGDDAVVDGQLRVHGCENLRVVDASVMPRVISTNLNAPTQMIAARAADYILGHAPLEPQSPDFAFLQS